ncbi:uncharacterized protein WCC33_013340 [Rhinophrynus dorsalis]
MGRLDERAKHRIVILRKAGLSFRKIKKVLELDDIKVTPQAIYLFLKRKNIEPENSASAPQNAAPKGQQWEEHQRWNVYQGNGSHNNAVNGAGAGCRGAQEVGNEEGIKIVSVTSLSRGNPPFQEPPNSQRQVLPGQAPPDTLNGPRPAQGVPTAPQQLHNRARTPLPGPKNPALLVTKKIVDRAISLQKKVTQNGAPVLAHGTHYSVAAAVASRPPAMRPVPTVSRQVKDVSTQTASCPPPPKQTVGGEQLDIIRGELHRLTQAVQTLMDRQNRWEQEQHRQRQCNHQEVIQQIQQLGATLAAKTNQNCGLNSGSVENEMVLPDFGHFKMELL